MHASRWKLTLIACAAASGAAAQVTAPSDAGHIPAAPPARPAEESEAPESGWRLPPLRVTGSLTYDMRATRTAGEASSIGHVVTGTIGSSTYLYAPWLATLNGSIGLSTSVTHSGSGAIGNGFDDAEVHNRLRTRETFVTGEGRLDLFPRSRFPAEIHFGRQDSRTDSGLASAIAFQRTNIGASMRYQPPTGLYTLLGAYDHRDQTGLGFRDKQDSASIDFNTRWKANDLSLGGSYSRARSQEFDEQSTFAGLVARHTYAPSTALSVSSTANLTRTEQRGAGESDLQLLQLSSVGIYHPDQSPLTLTGSVRGLALRDKTTDQSTDSFSANLGANYLVNPNLRLTANGGASVTRSGAGSASFFNGGAGATYQGDTLEFRGIRYDWFAGASFGTAIGDSSNGSVTRERNLGLQLGHTANKSWQLSPLSSLGLSAGQTLSANNTHSSSDDGSGTGLGTTKTLLNTLALSWQRNGDGKSGFARASYSDSIELGGRGDRFQLFNFQLSGNFELDHGRSISGDFTYQRSIQRVGEPHNQVDPLALLQPRTRSSGISGEIAFRQNQVFGVPRLRFVSRLRLAQDVLKQPGQLLSFPDRETRLWENRLEWNIGRLTTQLELRLSQIDGRRVDSLWLRVQRNFGD